MDAFRPDKRRGATCVETSYGKSGEDSRRWLGRFQRELDAEYTGAVPAKDWLEDFKTHLGGEAARWADAHPTVKDLLAIDHIEDTDEDRPN